jgi:hypothetical protein
MKFDTIKELINKKMTAALEVYGEAVAREANKTAIGAILGATQLQKWSAHDNGEVMHDAIKSLNGCRFRFFRICASPFFERVCRTKNRRAPMHRVVVLYSRRRA